MAKKYRITKRKYNAYRQSGLWGVVCYTYGTCPFIPRAETHAEAIAMMENHHKVWHWHTPSNNTTKENSNV